MDPKLAEIYKTEESLQAEAEALATLNMVEKLAAAEDLDVEGMSDEEAEELAKAVLGSDSEEAPAEEQEESEEEGADGSEEEKTAAEKIAQEKVAEADHLGRVMAHAYVSEKAKIAAAAVEKAKTAGKKDGKVMGALKAKKASAEAPVEEESVSSLDQLAIARAQEILKENGIEPEQEKMSSIDEEKALQLQEKIQARAEELLVEAGYKFTE